MDILMKVWTWIKANGASVLGLVQAALKMVKEIVTAILNFVSIAFPVSAFERFILKIRDIVNVIDGWIEKIKAYFIPKA